MSAVSVLAGPEKNDEYLNTIHHNNFKGIGYIPRYSIGIGYIPRNKKGRYIGYIPKVHNLD